MGFAVVIPGYDLHKLGLDGPDLLPAVVPQAVSAPHPEQR